MVDETNRKTGEPETPTSLSSPPSGLGGADQTVGEILKRARERKQLTLQDIAAETRISLPMLELLEKDRFDEIGSEAYVKGFLRSYAQVVDLDPHGLFTRFAMQSGATHKRRDDLWEVEGPTVEHVRGPRIMNRFMIPVILVGIFVLLLLLLLRGGGGDDANLPSSSPARVLSAGEPALPSGGTESSPAAVDQTGADRAGGSVEAVPGARRGEGGSRGSGEEENRAAPAEAAGTLTGETAVQDAGRPPPVVPAATAPPPLVLVATVVESTWVQVSIDGGATQEYLFVSPEETMTWEASDHFLLTLGNAGGLRLRLNGIDLGPPGESGAILRDYRIDRTLLAP